MTFDSFSLHDRRPAGESDDDALELYLAGKLSGDAARRVERWLEESPEAADVVAAFCRGVVGSDVQAPDVGNAVWQVHGQGRARAGEQLRSFEARPLRGGIFKPHSPRRNVWYALASVALVLGAFAMGRYASVPWHHLPASAPVSAYVTAQGERASITLPDGNAVVLNVASRLEVPADYLAGNHIVRLHGEALFTVRHHSGIPFTVLAGTAATRVLGTQFLVRHYAFDTATTVVVRDGRVAVRRDATHSLVLTAARQATVTRAGVSAAAADPAAFSFAAGVLTLTGGRLSEVIPELDRWYDADIRLGDPGLATRRMAGEYAAGSLSDLTELLEGIFNLRVVRNGRILTLYRR